MQYGGPFPPRISFGVYEVDVQASELRKQGFRVKLQNQPFQILRLLLERPGQLVTREELRNRLWPTDTFVDFDRGLNRAINRLREALDDQSDNPRFIETVPRRGYRFVAAVELTPEVAAGAKPDTGDRQIYRARWIVTIAGLAVVLAIALLALNIAGLREQLLAHRDIPPIRSLAVLPLQNLSNDPGQEYFADGMTDELITEIAKIKALRVTSRTSVVQYKGNKGTLPAIAKQLGVDAILEGTVLRSGGKVRITTQLIYAPEDRHLWSETYERDLGDVIGIQREVADAVADRVQVKLSPRERSQFSANRPINPQCYESYLEGNFFRHKTTEPGLDRSIELYQRAIQFDPSYAQAYAGLAGAYVSLGIFGFRPASEVYPKAREAAIKALQLDGSIAEAHTMLADVKKGYDWDWQGAEAEYQASLALNPSFSITHMFYADYLAKMGRRDDAISEALRAHDLDPVSAGSNTVLCMTYYRARDYDQAIEACRRALYFDPSHTTALWFMALSHEQKGDLAAAISELERAAQISHAPLYLSLLGHAYGLSGNRTKAREILRDLGVLSKTRYVSPMDMAEVYLGLGDRDSTFGWLEKAYSERAMRIQELPDPIFDPLRKDPRFIDLSKRIGFGE